VNARRYTVEVVYLAGEIEDRLEENLSPKQKLWIHRRKLSHEKSYTSENARSLSKCRRFEIVLTREHSAWRVLSPTAAVDSFWSDRL